MSSANSPTNGVASAHVNIIAEANGAAASLLAPSPLETAAMKVGTAEINGDATSDAPLATPKKPDTPRKPRGPTKAQQMATTYQYPLPLRTFPLPTLIPHNPLSLLHILYIWLSQTFSPPTSHPQTPYQGIFSTSLRAVHLTDPVHIRALWEQGFYGKGSLSRSELSWLDREKRRVGEGASKTSEEVTRQRRAERQQVKWERARVQQEAIEAKRKEEELAAKGVDGSVLEAVEGHMKPLVAHVEIAPTGPMQLLSMPNSAADIVVDESSTPASSDALAPSPSELSNESTTSPVEDAPSTFEAAERASLKSVRFSASDQEHISSNPITDSANLQAATPDDAEELPLVIKDKEHLQLTTEEAFFLHYGLGVLSIHSPTTHLPIPTPELLQLFRRSSYFPVMAEDEAPKPDDQFMINYVVYHHFRSLGWVVRGGVKFGVDYLLYNRGPVFSHAEFAVIILPSYSDDHWKNIEPTPEYPSGTKMYADHKLRQRGKWSWVHAVNRVNAQVKKTVVLVYVDVPAPLAPEEEARMGIDEILARYKVREIVLKRWVSNRSRD